MLPDQKLRSPAVSYAKLYYKQVTNLKDYFNILALDSSNYWKIEEMDFTRVLAMFYSKTDTTIQIINWAMNKTRLLDQVSWVVYGIKSCYRSSFNEISPRMRLFNVRGKSLGRRRFPDKQAVSLTYIYHDFIKERCSISYTIGYWTSSSGLMVEKYFGHCCFNVSGYPVRSVYIERPSDFETVKTENNSTKFTGFTYDIYSDVVKYLELK
ncbi:Uncharacterised protein g11133 [Pycnogonum litorale]